MKNITKKGIYLDNRKFATITYGRDDIRSNKIIQVVQRNYPFLEHFFNFRIAPIKIHLLYSRSEINKYWGDKTPKWMCGFIKAGRNVYVLSPSVAKKVSGHLEKDIYKVIIHEMVHLFVKRINKNPLVWVDEGVALFLAKQDKPKSFKKLDWQFFINQYLTKNIDYRSFAENKGYDVSYWVVKIIIKRFGRKKITNLIKLNPQKDNIRSKLKALNISINNLLK